MSRGHAEAHAQIRSSGVQRHRETQIGLEARNVTPPMQDLNFTEDILWIRGLHPIRYEP